MMDFLSLVGIVYFALALLWYLLYATQIATGRDKYLMEHDAFISWISAVLWPIMLFFVMPEIRAWRMRLKLNNKKVRAHLAAARTYVRCSNEERFLKLVAVENHTYTCTHCENRIGKDLYCWEDTTNPRYVLHENCVDGLIRDNHHTWKPHGFIKDDNGYLEVI